MANFSTIFSVIFVVVTVFHHISVCQSFESVENYGPSETHHIIIVGHREVDPMFENAQTYRRVKFFCLFPKFQKMHLKLNDFELHRRNEDLAMAEVMEVDTEVEVDTEQAVLLALLSKPLIRQKVKVSKLFKIVVFIGRKV